jgi:hypothetical protein
LQKIHHLYLQIRRQAIEFSHILHRTQPGELALGQLARCCHAFFAQCGEADFPVEVLPGLAVADGEAISTKIMANNIARKLTINDSLVN